MTEITPESRDHLQLEELDSLAIEGGRALPRRSSAHAAECARCARDVRELKRVHSALLALAPLMPAAGFADRVLRRVRLPIPWRVRIPAAAREHRVATAAAFAGLAGVLGLGAAWAARYPDFTPITVTAFIIEWSTAQLWGAVMAAGRLVYGSGIVAAAQGLAEQMTLVTAFVAVATVTLVGLGALRIMFTLVNATPAARPVTQG